MRKVYLVCRYGNCKKVFACQHVIGGGMQYCAYCKDECAKREAVITDCRSEGLHLYSCPTCQGFDVKGDDIKKLRGYREYQEKLEREKFDNKKPEKPKENKIKKNLSGYKGDRKKDRIKLLKRKQRIKKFRERRKRIINRWMEQQIL